VDYISKPVSLPRLMQAIEKVRKSRTALVPISDAIFVRSEGQYVRLALDQLLWVETVGDYVMFRTITGKHIVHGTLKGMDEKLSRDTRFLKIHRSYIVNLECVDNIDETTLVIGEKVIPVSRAHRSILMKRISLI
jgi:DNA-binding LytR/AlgR family response regulator